MLARQHSLSRAKGGGYEYGLYFTLVFAISLVPAAARMVLPKTGQPRRFFVTHAWQMAGEVTPRIFSAL